MNHIDNFIQDLSKTINNISKCNKENYFFHKVDSFLKKHNDIESQNIMTNLLSKNISNHKEKIKYKKNDSDMILITQYYIAKDEHRFKENLICLINNIVNENISKIYLLNEEEYDLSFLFNKIGDNYRKKVKQIVIESRMTFLDGFNYANTFLKNKIVIIANLDIFFNETINQCKTYDFDNLFISLSRYDLQKDFDFDGSNTINKFSHQGGYGNPVIDSADSWIFQAPIKTCPELKIMLGSAGCDTILNHLFKYNLKYNVINPVNSIVSIHYHLDLNRQNFTDNLDQNRKSVSSNFVRDHSHKNYNSNNSFHPSNYNHYYLLQKNIVLCNKIESFSTFATKGAYSDLKLLLKSLEIYHNDIPVFILCDKWTDEQIEKDNYNLKIYKRIDLEKYCNMNREIMEKNNLFKEFLLKKCDTIDYSMSFYSNTVFIDADIVLLNKFDLMIDITYDVGLSPHNIFEETSKKFGIYNAGFMYIKNKNVTTFWRNKVNTYNGFDDQQALDYFKDEFNVYEFDDSYNFGWWRLFQCDNPQLRANLFTIDDTSIYYEYKTLKCVHTHFYQQNDNQTIQFNQFIIDMLDKIKHPMIKYILNQDIEKNDLNKNFDKIKENIVSLGSSCDGANILKYFNYQTKNKFFDFLWNEKRGLQAICEIIENDFLHFDKIENYDIQKNTIIAWEGSNLSNKQINKYYEDVLFYHNKTKINNNDIQSFKRKIERTKNIMNSNEYKYFIYYRHFNIGDNIDTLVNETNNFCNLYKTKYNNKFLLISCIMVQNNTNLNILEEIINKLNNNKTINVVYDYVYKTDDCDIEKTIISRNRWKIVLEKYINNSEKKNIQKNMIPKIIIPKQPRNDFWNHNNDTFRELLYMWSENNLCTLKEEDTKHVWYNAIGDILLYDRPTLEWIQNDSDLTVNKILFGNPLPPKQIENISSSWIFWGRQPRELEKLSNNNLDYSSRRIESIFIGKCENKVQEQFRLNQDWSNYIQVYKMHKADEKYIYSQNEYLQLLKNSKFGISLRGFGPKCNREIELMAFGTVPIIDSTVSMDYYDSPIENIHYFRINNPSDIKKIIQSCSEEKWNQMSQACVNWYKKNCSTNGSFQTTMNAIKDLINKPHKTVIQQNSSYEDVYSLQNTYAV